MVSLLERNESMFFFFFIPKATLINSYATLEKIAGGIVNLCVDISRRPSHTPSADLDASTRCTAANTWFAHDCPRVLSPHYLVISAQDKCVVSHSQVRVKADFLLPLVLCRSDRLPYANNLFWRIWRDSILVMYVHVAQAAVRCTYEYIFAFLFIFHISFYSGKPDTLESNLSYQSRGKHNVYLPLPLLPCSSQSKLNVLSCPNLLIIPLRTKLPHFSIHEIYTHKK